VKLASLILLGCHASCFGARDLFNIDPHLSLNPSVQTIPKEQLTFLGAVTGNNTALALVEDLSGRVYTVKPDQLMDGGKNKMIKILPDAIFLSNGQQFFIVK
jgi:hypothetical protein